MSRQMIVDCVDPEAAQALLLVLATTGYLGTRLSGTQVEARPNQIIVQFPCLVGDPEVGQINFHPNVLSAAPFNGDPVAVFSPDEIVQILV